MKKVLPFLLITFAWSCSKYMEIEPLPVKPSTQINNLTLAQIKQIISGDWNLYYTKQLGQSSFISIVNNKINFSNNSDSIKWIDNNIIVANNRVNYQYDTVQPLGITYKISFIKNGVITNFFPSQYDDASKILTLIDIDAMNRYYLYK